MKRVLFMGALLLALNSVRSGADPAELSAIARLQSRWAEINYQLPAKAREEAFEQLIEESETFHQQHPGDAGILIWDGIIKSSYAGTRSGLGALKYAKAAKLDLESAIAIDPQALNGSGYTSLGVLYFKVPGWPLGFGDNKKAAELLQKALAINPDGIDPNYFYAEYLRSENRLPEAEQYYQKSLQAAPRPGRELADQGRRGEIQAALGALHKARQ